jgi:hypothetical protein
LNLRDWGLCEIYFNSDVFGAGLSEQNFCFEQRTYQNDDCEMRRFIGLYGSRRAVGLKMLARRRRQKAHGVGLYQELISETDSPGTDVIPQWFAAPSYRFLHRN